ncbi:BCCT family transporter [Jonesia quinghaiensis]|uniref:BCCT family transporter n=1 Tax=Jonesia quinghaiensis TaxID=262806 RepID=UPI0004017132|nr:BCCT family transporter [Jonesia quinghaiensis]
MSKQKTNGRERPTDEPEKRASTVTTVLRKAVTPPQVVHPGLIPGIGVEKTGIAFPTNWSVFIIAFAATVSVLVWAIIAPDSIQTTGSTMLTWVIDHFSWLFTGLVIAVTIFMFAIGYGRTGGIRLGEDDEEPEYSTSSWVAMLFAAGLGIGLLFYGPMEPLTHYLNTPPGFEAEPGSPDAMLPAMAQTALHYGPLAWALYALLGGALAYSAYRRGRAPLISALFEPVFPNASNRFAGRLIDVFAIIVTLFGTAISLGIGALQIQSGFILVSGFTPEGNMFLIGSLALLTSLFIASAVSGVKRGIRALSNINMGLTIGLATFMLIAGPTVFLLNLIPASAVSFVTELGTMLMRNPNQGEESHAFLSAWTTFYWAWWVSWTPFVGMFIAKISRGRTLRQYVTTVVLVPAVISLVWFAIYGGTAISMTQNGSELMTGGSGEEVLFQMLANLPFGTLTSIIAMIAVVIFFITAADSASVVMGSMSQSGRPNPSAPVTITWGLLLGLIATFLLLAGGDNALSGLQSIMVVTALPFAFIIIGVMIAWAKELRTDPFIIRRTYAQEAIAQGVRRGIDEHGDAFVFSVNEVPEDEGAGASFDSDDPALTEWYVEATSDAPTSDTVADTHQRTTSGAGAGAGAGDDAPEPREPERQPV